MAGCIKTLASRPHAVARRVACRADADPNDVRVRQVCDLGGHSVTGFLAQMAKTSPELDEIVKAVKKS